MSIQFGSAFIINSILWQEVKTIIAKKNLALQYDEDNIQYTIYAIDNSIIYVTYIRIGIVPNSSGFNQAQNDADKDDFENNFKSIANQPIHGPSESDRKPIMVICPSTEGYLTWITGKGDDADAVWPDSGRGTGDSIVLIFSGSEVPCTKVLEFNFIEPVEIHDGQVTWKPSVNWDSRDNFSLGLRIPSSSITFNTSSLGNCNKVPIGPDMNVIVPAAGNGQYNLIVARPIQDKQNQGGYWNNDYDTGVVTPNPIPGKGKWNLFDFEITGWLIKNISMTHPMGVFDIDVYKTEYFHPSWHLTWKVTKNSPGDGEVSGWIFCFRRFVT